MQIIDAQVHIWSGGKPTNATHRQVEKFTADDLLKEMDEGGVNAAIIHPPASWDPNSNELAVEAARKHPTRLAILGNFQLDKLENRKLVETWKQRPGMLGLRFALLAPHQQTWLTDGTMDWLWPAAERAGLPVALIGGSSQNQQVDGFAIHAIVRAADVEGVAKVRDIAANYRDDYLRALRAKGSDAEREAGRLGHDEVRGFLTNSILPRLAERGIILSVDGDLEHWWFNAVGQRVVECQRGGRVRPELH